MKGTEKNESRGTGRAKTSGHTNLENMANLRLEELWLLPKVTNTKILRVKPSEVHF
jgi:hypothetical protein